MAEKHFQSHNDFKLFANSVRRKNRFILDEFKKNFLDTIISTSESRVKYIKERTSLWRAQRGSTTRKISIENDEVEFEEDLPYPSERMVPLENKCSEARANPKGIRHLYLSNLKETALAEVRPFLKENISLGHFKAAKNLKVVDCSNDPKKDAIAWDGNDFVERIVDPTEREEIVWGDINEAFSRPINKDDIIDEYVPSQIIAEVFKMNDFDGVVYKSSLDEGYNVVLFDVNSVKLVECCLYRLDKICYNFNRIGNWRKFK